MRKLKFALLFLLASNFLIGMKLKAQKINISTEVKTTTYQLLTEGAKAFYSKGTSFSEFKKRLVGDVVVSKEMEMLIKDIYNTLSTSKKLSNIKAPKSFDLVLNKIQNEGTGKLILNDNIKFDSNGNIQAKKINWGKWIRFAIKVLTAILEIFF